MKGFIVGFNILSASDRISESIVQLLEVAAISQRVKFLPFAISQQLLTIGLMKQPPMP